ncbi:DUF1566 domain-containing protein [Thiomicrorhabdus sp.]|uniref:Lcl domain-containing protein n=1 Tax=Thiomicrorhabdus sp. TaxID=2039724 RepID=UPI0029C80C0E|nr:DUF1566 domain-containing protein [Thiomicrorhabdus sp.]
MYPSYRKAPGNLLKLSLAVALFSSLSGCFDSSSSSSSSPPINDVTPPVISLSGSNPYEIKVGSVYSDPGATATDDVDGNISLAIVIGGDSVDVNTVGSYTVTYDVSDAAGNAATQVSRTVNVLPFVAVNSLPMNDTGITWGGNYPEGNNSDCTGETIDEQDCSFGRDVKAASGSLAKAGGGMVGFDFTKLGSDGTALLIQDQAYDANGDEALGTKWSCVRDNHTGLIWEMKTDMARGTDLHSNDDVFNWYNSDPASNGGAVGYADNVGDVCTGYDANDSATFCNTEAFVARVNAAGFCGATDWRLPSLIELQSIVHYGRTSPTIDQNYFANVTNRIYLVSTPTAHSTYFAKSISFDSGGSALSSRDSGSRVMLVRDAD